MEVLENVCEQELIGRGIQVDRSRSGPGQRKSLSGGTRPIL